MSKFDWSRASFRIFDPARVQRFVDFMTPDGPNKHKKKKKKPKLLIATQRAEHEKRVIAEAVDRRAKRTPLAG